MSGARAERRQRKSLEGSEELGAMFATRNKCIASSNKCLTSSNNKATFGTKGIATNGARMLLGSPGLTTRSKDATIGSKNQFLFQLSLS